LLLLFQVKDLLATDISEPSEALAAVGVPIEKTGEVEAGAAEGGPQAGATATPTQTTGGPPSSSSSTGVQFDSSVTRHLLHSVDEVLRRGESQEYFKNVPQEKLEQMMRSEGGGVRRRRKGAAGDAPNFLPTHSHLTHSLTSL